MRFEPYIASELRFAYCYRIYLRFRTHFAKPVPELAQLTRELIQPPVERLGVHILELAANQTSCMCLISLRPENSVSAAVSKLKGQVSKWLRGEAGHHVCNSILSRGYFAVTTGKSAQEAIKAYLEAQGQHHGFDGRWARPPVFVRSFQPSGDDEQRLQAAHSCSLLRLHLVFATQRRIGVFSQTLSAAVTEKWQAMTKSTAFALQKVSFVPDHVHVALRVHPSLCPAELASLLMNEAQSVAEAAFKQTVRPPPIERLWQPSAYLGSFGDLASPQISRYLQRWATRSSE